MTRILIEQGFEAALGETTRAIRDEGLQLIARVDVRDHFWRDLAHEFRRYFLLQAWSPQLAFQALQEDPDAGGCLHMTFAVYEVNERETAVVVSGPWSTIPGGRTRHDSPTFTAFATQERERAMHVAERLRHVSRLTPLLASADD